MFDRRRAAAATALVVLVLAAVPVRGGIVGRKPPTHLTYSVIHQSSHVMFSGSCTVKRESDPPPAVTAGFAVWDAATIVNTTFRLTLRPVLAGGIPTGEFIFSGDLSAAALDAPLAGRLAVDAPDCELLTLGSLVQDAAGVVPPYSVHVAR